MKMILTALVAIIYCISLTTSTGQIVSQITSIDEPLGALTPKSIVHNGRGIFAAQNMMYNHSICFYDRSFDLIKQLDDKVRLSDYGFCDLDHWYQGSPVECDFSADGRFAYVSNYKLYGKGFDSNAEDNCLTSSEYERGYVYKIDIDNFDIVDVYEVGSVPKYVFYVDRFNLLAVSNWCSGTISLLDLSSGKESKEIPVGRYPRGIALYKNTLLVSIMGEQEVAMIDLVTRSVKGKFQVGSGPRDLHVDESRDLLYISLNNENALVTFDLAQEKVIKKKYLGELPRSMALSKDGKWLFVCLYGEHRVAIIEATSGKIVQTVRSCYKPIGVEFDDEKKQLWVACYGGEISIYQMEENPATDILEPQKVTLPEAQKKSFTEAKTYIVCGSFKDLKNASNRKQQLTALGVPATINSSQGFHRVSVYVADENAAYEKAKLEDLLGFELWLYRL
ncbi:MAG TPA: beta-propeller fold lactonase family protein [Saprospiraceae bacterium]|nr:beta-propeller fold lactonase family protein [Saprospiraceae bacterium]